MGALVESEPERELSIAAGAILGLIDLGGPQTIYDLKVYIQSSIGYFWPFPHSQLYAEARRLETDGYLAAELEAHGRRRKILSLTPAGSAALEQWRAADTYSTTEIRDVGLVKLFCSSPDPEAIASLAARQRDAHAAQLAEYQALAAHLAGAESPATFTLNIGLEFEQVAIDFWESVAEKFGPS